MGYTRFVPPVLAPILPELMAPPPRILAVYSSSYDDTDSAVVYHGSWTTSTKIPGLGVYNHTITETKQVGDTAVFNFEGARYSVPMSVTNSTFIPLKLKDPLSASLHSYTRICWRALHTPSTVKLSSTTPTPGTV